MNLINKDPFSHLGQFGQALVLESVSPFRHFYLSASGDKVYQAYLGHRKLVQAGRETKSTTQIQSSFSPENYRIEGAKALLKFAGLDESEIEIVRKYMDLFFVFFMEPEQKVKLDAFNRYFPWLSGDNEKLSLCESLSQNHKESLRESILWLRQCIQAHVSSPSPNTELVLSLAKETVQQAVRDCLEAAGRVGLPKPKARVRKVPYLSRTTGISAEDLRWSDNRRLHVLFKQKIKQIGCLWNRFKEMVGMKKETIIRSDIRT